MSSCEHVWTFSLQTTGTYCRQCGLVKVEHELYTSQCWLVNGQMPLEQSVPYRPVGYTRLSRFRQIVRECFNLRGVTQSASCVSPGLLAQAKRLTHKWRAQRPTPARLRYIWKRERLGPLTEDKASQVCYQLGYGQRRREPSKEVLEELTRLFKKTDECWPRVLKKLRERFAWARRCFLNYQTLLRALLLLMGEEELALQVPELKQAESRHRQSAMFALVCEEQGWDFIPLTGCLNGSGFARPLASHLLSAASKKKKKKKKKKKSVVGAVAEKTKSSIP